MKKVLKNNNKVIKIAFFVEGLTECLFVEKALIEWFGQKNISIDKIKLKGGKNINVSIKIIETQIFDNSIFYIQIYDCGGDSSISSYIRDRRPGLLKAGFIKIYGLRDVFPDFKLDEVADLKKTLQKYIPQKGLPTKIFLSVMEIESWFISELNHYKKISSDLTLDLIIKKIGFHPGEIDTELIKHPSSKLDNIYALVGLSYEKKKNIIERTIKALDFSNIFLDAINRNNSLKEFIMEIKRL